MVYKCFMSHHKITIIPAIEGEKTISWTMCKGFYFFWIVLRLNKNWTESSANINIFPF